MSSIKSAKAFSDQLAFNVVKQAEEKGVEFRDDEMHMKDTVSCRTDSVTLDLNCHILGEITFQLDKGTALQLDVQFYIFVNF